MFVWNPLQAETQAYMATLAAATTAFVISIQKLQSYDVFNRMS